MPVDIDRFEAADDLGDPTTSERILRFLSAHDSQAFTRRELATAIDADPETVGTNLTRLKARELVRHRAPYWAFTDDQTHARDELVERYDDAVVTRLIGEPGDDAGTDDRLGLDPGDGDRDRERSFSRGGHRTAADDYFDRVRDRLGDAVETLYLFGSVARSAEAASSDVDVLAVVSDDVDYVEVDDVLLELAYDVQLDHGVRIEVHPIRASEFADRQERGDPFVRGVLAEAGIGG